jgi:RES domain-containing protein
MVYTATSRALAALEFFVNLEPNEAPDDLLIAEATVPDECAETIDLKLLPRNWRALNNQRCRDLGSAWAASLRSLALKVPLVVVDGDWNVLLNPKHPEFTKVAIGSVKPFRFDERMFR